MTGRCKGCGTPVPLVIRKKKPRAICDDCRANIGEFNGAAKLTARDVLAIRRAPPPYKLVAESFGVTQATVCDIRKRRS